MPRLRARYKKGPNSFKRLTKAEILKTCKTIFTSEQMADLNALFKTPELENKSLSRVSTEDYIHFLNKLKEILLAPKDPIRHVPTEIEQSFLWNIDTQIQLNIELEIKRIATRIRAVQEIPIKEINGNIKSRIIGRAAITEEKRQELFEVLHNQLISVVQQIRESYSFTSSMAYSAGIFSNKILSLPPKVLGDKNQTLEKKLAVPLYETLKELSELPTHNEFDKELALDLLISVADTVTYQVPNVFARMQQPFGKDLKSAVQKLDGSEKVSVAKLVYEKFEALRSPILELSSYEKINLLTGILAISKPEGWSSENTAIQDLIIEQLSLCADDIEKENNSSLLKQPVKSLIAAINKFASTDEQKINLNQIEKFFNLELSVPGTRPNDADMAKLRANVDSLMASLASDLSEPINRAFHSAINDLDELRQQYTEEETLNPIFIYDKKISTPKTIYKFGNPPIVLQWTDCEGDWVKVQQSIVAMNETLKKQGIAQPIEIVPANQITGTAEYIKLPTSKEHPIVMVFGGDATDNGASDTRIKHLLLNTKLQQADNVVITIGNRDMLDFRYVSELDKGNILDQILKNTMPSWIEDARKTTFAEFMLQEIFKDKNTINATTIESLRTDLTTQSDKRKIINTWLASRENRQILVQHLLKQYGTKSAELEFLYLQWADKFTMGRPNRIAYRRQELATRKASQFLIGEIRVLISEYDRKLHDIQAAYTQESKVYEAQKKAIKDDPKGTRLSSLTKAFAAATDKFNKERTRLINNLDDALRVHIPDSKVLDDIKSSVIENGINDSLRKTSNGVASIGTDSAGYISTLHGAPAEDAMTINGHKYEDYNEWMLAYNEYLQFSLDAVYRPTAPTSQEPLPAFIRLALPNGTPYPEGDKRNEHVHTGTVISCQCFKVKKVTLSNGVEITQKMHDIAASVRNMALETGKVFGWLTGHKPTGASNLGTIDTEILSDGTMQIQTSTDTTYRTNADAVSVVCVDFGQTTMQTTMTRAEVKHSVYDVTEDHTYETESVQFTALPIVGMGAPKLPFGQSVIGKTIFAPQFSPASSDGKYRIPTLTEIEAIDPQPKIFAWTIVKVEHEKDTFEKDRKYVEVDSEISSITLQRMENEFTSVEITLDNITTAELKALSSYSALKVVKSQYLDEKGNPISDTAESNADTVIKRANVTTASRLDTVIKSFSILSALSESIKTKTIGLSDAETTTALNRQIFGVIALLDAAAHGIKTTALLGGKSGIRDAQRELLKLITQTSSDMPMTTIVEDFFTEHKNIIRKSNVLTELMQEERRNPVFTSKSDSNDMTAFNLAIRAIKELVKGQPELLSNIDALIVTANTKAPDVSQELLNKIVALDKIAKGTKNHDQSSTITKECIKAEHKLIAMLAQDVQKSQGKATELSTAGYFKDVERHTAQTAIAETRLKLQNLLQALQLSNVYKGSAGPAPEAYDPASKTYAKEYQQVLSYITALEGNAENAIKDEPIILTKLKGQIISFTSENPLLHDSIRQSLVVAEDAIRTISKLESELRINDKDQIIYDINSANPTLSDLQRLTLQANQVYVQLQDKSKAFTVLHQAEKLEAALQQAMNAIQAQQSDITTDPIMIAAEEARNKLLPLAAPGQSDVPFIGLVPFKRVKAQDGLLESMLNRALSSIYTNKKPIANELLASDFLAEFKEQIEATVKSISAMKSVADDYLLTADTINQLATRISDLLDSTAKIQHYSDIFAELDALNIKVAAIINDAKKSDENQIQTAYLQAFQHSIVAARAAATFEVIKVLEKEDIEAELKEYMHIENLAVKTLSDAKTKKIEAEETNQDHNEILADFSRVVGNDLFETIRLLLATDPNTVDIAPTLTDAITKISKYEQDTKYLPTLIKKVKEHKYLPEKLKSTLVQAFNTYVTITSAQAQIDKLRDNPRVVAESTISLDTGKMADLELEEEKEKEKSSDEASSMAHMSTREASTSISRSSAKVYPPEEHEPIDENEVNKPVNKSKRNFIKTTITSTGANLKSGMNRAWSHMPTWRSAQRHRAEIDPNTSEGSSRRLLINPPKIAPEPVPPTPPHVIPDWFKEQTSSVSEHLDKLKLNPSEFSVKGFLEDAKYKAPIGFGFYGCIVGLCNYYATMNPPFDFKQATLTYTKSADIGPEEKIRIGKYNADERKVDVEIDGDKFSFESVFQAMLNAEGTHECSIPLVNEGIIDESLAKNFILALGTFLDMPEGKVTLRFANEESAKLVLKQMDVRDPVIDALVASPSIKALLKNALYEHGYEHKRFKP